MGKKLTGSLYSFKVSATNVIANFDMGKALIVIRDDLIGKTKTSGQGLIVKTAEGTKLLKEVKEDIANNKCKFPMIVVGFFGKDIIMLVTDKEFPSYEESCVLVKDYKAISTCHYLVLVSTAKRVIPALSIATIAPATTA